MIWWWRWSRHPANAGNRERVAPEAGQTAVVVAEEGINDITGATRSGQAGKTFTADTLIAAYRQVIETAHAQASASSAAR